MVTPDSIEDTARFDFVQKLARIPDRVEAVLRRDLAKAISTIYLDINTDICNHNCPFCDGFFRKLDAAHLPWHRLARLVEEMEELEVLSVVLAGDRGEPFLHPKIGELLERLAGSSIQFGIYTNGTRIPQACMRWLRKAAFIRISADSATPETHRAMHGYPEGRNDFQCLLANLRQLADLVDDIGVSFVLDPINAHAVRAAGDLFLGEGARFIEFKPKCLHGYKVDREWLAQRRPELCDQLAQLKKQWGERVVLNNQIESLLNRATPPSLSVTPRLCRTSLLRLAISTHGCYTCTPYRGERERAVGDIRTQSLREVVESAARLALIERPCGRFCAYHEQNEMLLGIEMGKPSPPTPHRPGRPQDWFV